MKRIWLSPPWTGAEEREEISRAFDTGYIAPCGPKVDEFERMLASLAGRDCAVAVSSGTAALDLLAAHFGVDASWTVVAPTLTFIATVAPFFHRGAELVFVDSDATGNVDLALLGGALRDASRETPGKTLFVGVDLYGRCCDWDAVGKLCAEHGVLFVGDSAEAVGAAFGSRPAGSEGAAAVFSFNGNKIVTTSGGGAVLTDDAELAAHVRSLSQQSREPVAWYEHREAGYNCRMSGILAALGIAQLRKLPEILRRRRANRDFYASIEGLELLPPVEGENCWLTVALMPDAASRDALIAALAAADVESRPVWKPMHLQPVFAHCRVAGGDVARGLFERGVCLPSGSGMDDADRARIREVVCTQLSRT